MAHRRLLVAVDENDESLRAVDAARRLAATRGAAVELVTVIELPTVLPLDAQMRDEEQQARALLGRADAVADSYGLAIASRVLRARSAGEAIVAEANAARCELIVIGAPRKRRARPTGRVFGRTVDHVLKHARCRVMVIAAREAEAAVSRVGFAA